jgi:tryptophanyl-tRNA synthetase
VKITISFKTPDAIAMTIQDQLLDLENRFLERHRVECKRDLSDQLAEELSEMRQDLKHCIASAAERWIQYGEYLRVELNTEANTCTVLPVN